MHIRYVVQKMIMCTLLFLANFDILTIKMTCEISQVLQRFITCLHAELTWKCNIVA